MSGRVRGLLFGVRFGDHNFGDFPLGFRVFNSKSHGRGRFGFCISGSGRVQESKCRGFFPRVSSFWVPDYITSVKTHLSPILSLFFGIRGLFILYEQLNVLRVRGKKILTGRKVLSFTIL